MIVDYKSFLKKISTSFKARFLFILIVIPSLYFLKYDAEAVHINSGQFNRNLFQHRATKISILTCI